MGLACTTLMLGQMGVNGLHSVVQGRSPVVTRGRYGPDRLQDPWYFSPASMLLNGTGGPPKSPTMPIQPDRS
jgi:hypothetical protein